MLDLWFVVQFKKEYRQAYDDRQKQRLDYRYIDQEKVKKSIKILLYL